MGKVVEIIEENIRHNLSVDYSHIKDHYFKDKLDKGLIKYEPENWTELPAIEENKLEGYSH